MKTTSALLSLVALITPGLGQEIDMGSASTFAVSAVAGVISTGNTVITGDVGTTTRSVSGFPPGIITGTVSTGSSAASDAQTDAFAAFDQARALTPTVVENSSAAELTDETFTPGVYSFEQAISIFGTVTLDGNGQSNSTFVFQIPSSMASTNNSQVLLTGGALAENVFWTAGNDVVLGAFSTIPGTIITDRTISVQEGAVINGGLFSGASITLADATITINA